MSSPDQISGCGARSATARPDTHPPGCLLVSGVNVARALRRVIEPAFIEERFDEGDDVPLILGGEIGRASQPSPDQ